MQFKAVNAGTLTLAVALACGCGGESRPGAALSVAVDTTQGVSSAFVVVAGYSSEELRLLGALPDSARATLVRMRVDDGALPMAGRVSVSDSAVEFRPRFGLDRGTVYELRALRSVLSDSAIIVTVQLPLGDRTPKTRVTALYPRADTVPENLLRLYVEFNAPMSSTGGLDYVRLLDDRGREVKAAFLPLEADFWNHDRTRYTLFLDPGRVKQGILPNEQLGRPLIAGRRYAIVIDSTWKDADRIPLVESFRHEFVVAASDETVIDTKSWRITAPSAKSNGALIVSFPDALDHGLLMRAIGVETMRGEAVSGDVDIPRGELEWRFTPKDRWRPGAYHLVVYTILEDPSGNQIDKKFEVDMFERVDKSAAPERKYIPFTVR